MILPIQHAVRSRLVEVIGRLYNIPADDPVLAQIAVEIPPRRALGDLADPAGLRARPPAAQGPARDRPGAGRRARRRSTASRGSRPRRTATSTLFIDRQAALTALAARRRHAPRPPATARRSSSTPRSTRTRRRTSATCGTPRSATRSGGCSASSAARSRSRTTSTTPASRSPTSRSASASSSTSRSTRSAHIADTSRFDFVCWDLYARVTEWYKRGQGAARRSASQALHDIEHGGNDTAALAHFIADRIVRCHLDDDAADEHRLRPAHVGRRHPEAALLDPRLRVSEEDRAPSSCRPRGGSRAAGS